MGPSFLTSAVSMAREIGSLAKSAFKTIQRVAGSGGYDSIGTIAMNKELNRTAAQLLAKAA